jgi:hypothetical protein
LNINTAGGAQGYPAQCTSILLEMVVCQGYPLHIYTEGSGSDTPYTS